MGRVAKQGEGKDSVCLLSAVYCVRKQRSVYEECWGGVESGAGGGAGGAGDARPRLPAPAHLRVRHNCKWQQCHNEDTGGDKISLFTRRILLRHLIND